jgi:hypothetical protein
MIELKYATDLQGELDLMKMCNCFSCKRAIDLIERIDGLMGEVAARAAAPAPSQPHPWHSYMQEHGAEEYAVQNITFGTEQKERM